MARESVIGRPWDAAAAALGLLVLAAWMHPAADRPLTWDEVDYVAAARAGTWANLTDRGAMDPVAFVRFALAKAERRDAQAVADASGYVEAESMLRLRHWHPPGGVLPLAPAVAAVGPERGARLMQLAWSVVLALLLVQVLREVAPTRPSARALGVLVVLLDPLTRHAVLEAHFHVALAAALLLPLWVWLRVTRDPLEARRLGALREAARPGRPTAPMAGRAGATVLGMALGVVWSTAVVAPLWTLAWVAALLIHRDTRDWLGRDGGAPWMIAGLLAGLIVLWPATFTRLSLIQTYGLGFYAVFFQGGREWSSATAALGGFVRQSPSLLVYALLGLAALTVGVARGRRDALAAGAAAVAFLVVIIPFAIIDRYLLPLLPLAAVAGACLIGSGDPDSPAPRGRGVTVLTGAAAAAILVCWALAPGFEYPQQSWTNALREEYARVDLLAADGTEVLAEGGHIFRHYASAGSARIRPVLVDYDGRRLLLRDGVRYDTVAAERAALIVLQRRAVDEPQVFDALAARCRREDFTTHVHFACGVSR